MNAPVENMRPRDLSSPRALILEKEEEVRLKRQKQIEYAQSLRAKMERKSRKNVSASGQGRYGWEEKARMREMRGSPTGLGVTNPEFPGQFSPGGDRGEPFIRHKSWKRRGPLREAVTSLNSIGLAEEGLFSARQFSGVMTHSPLRYPQSSSPSYGTMRDRAGGAPWTGQSSPSNWHSTRPEHEPLQPSGSHHPMSLTLPRQQKRLNYLGLDPEFDSMYPDGKSSPASNSRDEFHL
jgi:hypothetical protein